MSVRVLRAGMLTTVQDLGRVGHQHEGVSVCGAMDAPALRLANAIVGNPESAAGLEATLLGPTLQFLDDVVFCIAGADLAANLDRQSIAMHRALHAPAGALLTFGERVNGCRAYVAFAGGIDVPVVLGSRSTDLRARFGGFKGRALAKDDVIEIGKLDTAAPRVSAEITLSKKPRAEVTVRALPGRHFELLTAESRALLFSEEAGWFRITPQSDRMGYRLEGPALAFERPIEMVSEPVAFGTVQLPPGGNPIVLMADRQTTGGYPRVLEVATVDLPLLAQAAPGTRVRFARTTLEAAQDSLKHAR